MRQPQEISSISPKAVFVGLTVAVKESEGSGAASFRST